MKFIVVMMLLMHILCSCAGEDPAETKIDYGDVNFVSGEYEGYIDTTFEKIADITRFLTERDVSSFLTRPVTCITGNKTYLIRNFPEEIPDDYESYDDYVLDGFPGMSSVIEVYDNHNYTDEPTRISVEWMDEVNFNPYALYYNRDDTLTLTGLKGAEDNLYVDYLYQVSLTGEPVFEAPLPIDNYDRYDFLNDYLYILDDKAAPMHTSCTLRQYNIKTDEESVIDTEVEAFSLQDNSVLYIKRGYPSQEKYTAELYRYHISDQSRELICTTEPFEIMEDNWYGVNSVFYDEADNIIYYSNYDTILAYIVESGEYLTVFEVLDSGVEILQTLGNELLLGVGNNQVSVYALPSELTSVDANIQTLRVCWYSGMPLTLSEQREEVLKIMKAEGVPVKIEEILNIDRADEYVNTAAKKILSGDDDFDLIYIDTSMPGLMDEKYYCDLSEFDVLAEPLAALKSSVRELCLVNGIQTFVPTSLYTTALQIHTSLLSGQYDIPKNFDDITAFRDAVSSELSNDTAYFMHGVNKRSLGDPWFEQIISNYMCGNIDDDMMKSDLQRVFDFCIDMSANDKVNISGTSGDIPGLITLIDNTAYFLHAAEGTTCIPIPKLNDGCKDVFNGRYIAINPNSANKELAALFLAYCMEYDRQDHGISGLSYLYQSDSENHTHNAVFDKQLENSIRNVQISDLYALLNEKFNKIETGAITVEQAVEETFRYLKMIRDE